MLVFVLLVVFVVVATLTYFIVAPLIFGDPIGRDNPVYGHLFKRRGH